MLYLGIDSKKHFAKYAVYKKELKMANTHFTQEYLAVSDPRKVEILVEALTKIVYYNDLDTEEVMNAINAVAEIRSKVSRHFSAY